MGKLSQFQFMLDSNQVVYYPGQIISGNVSLTLNEPMKMRSIKMKMKGESSCHWTETRSTGTGEDRETETIHYRGKEHVMKDVRYLFGNSSSESDLHPAGSYVYPFSFTLFAGIPSSFEGPHGHIRYTLKCNIDKPWKFDHKLKRAFTVNDIIDPNHTMYAVGPGGEKHKEVGCLCCKSGPLELSTNIDRSCYCPGEAILINANVQNKTSRNMDALNAKLIQTIYYHGKHQGHHKTKAVARVVAKLSGPTIPKGEDVQWMNQPFGIPALPPTITNSKIITVHYKVHVVVDLPWGIDPYVKMHVTMGTVPYMKVYGQPIQYGTPQDQQAPPQSNFGDFAYPPPPPSVFGYPDMPPPSYSAAFGETGVSIAKEKDNHTYGDLTYNPVYTFAQPYQGQGGGFSDAPPAYAPPPVYPPPAAYPPPAGMQN